MKRFFHYRSALVFGSLLVLSACGGSDSDDDGDQAITLGELKGRYSGAYLDSDGQPNLTMATLVDTSNLTLVILDEQDRRTEYTGRYDATSKGVSFGGATSCQAVSAGLSCSLDGKTVALASAEVDSLAYDVADMAGTYRIRIDGELQSLVLESDGQFSVNNKRCETTGLLASALEGKVIIARLTGSDCGSALTNGFIETDSLYSDHDVVVAYLPGSELSGHWIR
ncbi:hypothetical protein [Marinobacter fonticola]|uniref:hypothetical protein n=1 Tax=Marinobacter fonticola TaxID=2603215 RepID=UPI0011E6DCED|nr:hypothetical protein [Marinobacter fonticola]